ncbi:VWA-like domain-containing protein [uncultured Roseobacter sp.]|uniref:vWA domain-containing protein n=1 Tax=uncultured Roseobacter sp. TaxID=114847 RepID=UPI00262C9C3E|nr:VWA-like domain-containing protein [uncultured Roseobacter sp.]
MMHSVRASQALARLPEIDPAIAALALWCSYRDSDWPTTTQGETIHLGPEFPLLPVSEQTGLMAHHVLHVALRHSARREAARERYGPHFRAEIYDLACDALVNEALLQGGHALPRPAVRAAEIVALLPADERPDNVLADLDSDKLYAVLAAQTAERAGGDGDPVARYAQTQGFVPDLKGSASDTGEADVWSGRVEQAMQAGRSAGSGIGAALSGFGDLPKAVIPWDIRLRRLLGRALAQHPRLSYRRPARVWLARDALARQTGGVQPAFEPVRTRATPRPRLVIALDTSSSIHSTTLDMFAAEAMSMIRRTGADAHLLGFDSEVHSRHHLRSADALSALKMRQGGGTDFAAVLDEAGALDPSMIVVLTDLDAPTGRACAASVLWAVPVRPITPPSFGEVLIMNDLDQLSPRTSVGAARVTGSL